MEFSEVVRKRRMVRDFDARAVPDDVLERVLESALRAPSAGFAQGLELVVLRRPEELEMFWSVVDPRGRKGSAGGRPPVVVVAYSNVKAYLERYGEEDKRGLGMDVAESWPVPYWDLDAAMGVMLMLLSATDVGLDAWYFGIFQGRAELDGLLRVPDGFNAIGAIGLGYRRSGEKASGSGAGRPRRSLAESIHIGVFSRHDGG